MKILSVGVTTNRADLTSSHEVHPGDGISSVFKYRKKYKSQFIRHSNMFSGTKIIFMVNESMDLPHDHVSEN